jgi:hypothetical protein
VWHCLPRPCRGGLWRKKAVDPGGGGRLALWHAHLVLVTHSLRCRVSSHPGLMSAGVSQGWVVSPGWCVCGRVQVVAPSEVQNAMLNLGVWG